MLADGPGAGPGRAGAPAGLAARPRGGAWRIAGLAMLSLLGGCSGGVLDPQGPVGRAERTILFDSLAIMLAIGIPTMLVGLYFAWWYRASNTRARYLPEWAYSGRLELLVWSIPTLTILFLGGLTWVGSHRLDPAVPISSTARPLEVQVVSLDWKWLFIYPEQGVASVNELVVPAATPVHFSLTSGSVMNVFFVPQLGSMIYTMNGMVTQLHLQADHPGAYFGESAQFSGDGFSRMTFTLRSVPPDGFQAWVTAARQAGASLDLDAYTALARQSRNVTPFTYRMVQPDLFRTIATRKAPAGPGPTVGRGGPKVSHRTES